MSTVPRWGTIALTALTPLAWGSTYAVTTEFLPPDRPLFTALMRALPAGLVLLAVTRVLPRGGWIWRAAVLGVLNIGAFFPLLSSVPPSPTGSGSAGSPACLPRRFPSWPC